MVKTTIFSVLLIASCSLQAMKRKADNASFGGFVSSRILPNSVRFNHAGTHIAIFNQMIARGGLHQNKVFLLNLETLMVESETDYTNDCCSFNFSIDDTRLVIIAPDGCSTIVRVESEQEGFASYSLTTDYFLTAALINAVEFEERYLDSQSCTFRINERMRSLNQVLRQALSDRWGSNSSSSNESHSKSA